MLETQLETGADELDRNKPDPKNRQNEGSSGYKCGSISLIIIIVIHLL